MTDYTWTDKTGRTQRIEAMDTDHLVNVVNTIWGWAMKRIHERKNERELYEQSQMLLPGIEDIESAPPDFYNFTADHYEVFEPMCQELSRRSVRVDNDGDILHVDRVGSKAYDS